MRKALKLRRDFRPWWPEAEVERGSPCLWLELLEPSIPPSGTGICSQNPTTQAAHLVAEELDLLLVDLPCRPREYLMHPAMDPIPFARLGSDPL